MAKKENLNPSMIFQANSAFAGPVVVVKRKYS